MTQVQAGELPCFNLPHTVSLSAILLSAIIMWLSVSPSTQVILTDLLSLHLCFHV